MQNRSQFAWSWKKLPQPQLNIIYFFFCKVEWKKGESNMFPNQYNFYANFGFLSELTNLYIWFHYPQHPCTRVYSFPFNARFDGNETGDRSIQLIPFRFTVQHRAIIIDHKALTSALSRLRRICSARSEMYSRLPTSSARSLQKKRRLSLHTAFISFSLLGTTPLLRK